MACLLSMLFCELQYTLSGHSAWASQAERLFMTSAVFCSCKIKDGIERIVFDSANRSPTVLRHFWLVGGVNILLCNP